MKGYELARLAILCGYGRDETVHEMKRWIAKFSETIRIDERLRCAAVCYDLQKEWKDEGAEHAEKAASDCALAILQRAKI